MTVPPSKSFGSSLIICVLALLSIFPPLATDMYLSAIGELAVALDASHAATELSLSLFFLGLCVGQLLIGPLIDVYGRKLPLLLGAGLFVMTSIALLIVRDVHVFNALRFLQAIGACAGMVVGRVIVMDLYEGRKAAKVLTILVMLMTLGPILAPFLGSLLLGAFGWESIFVVLVLIGVLAFVLVAAIIPETLPVSKRRSGTVGASFGHLFLLARRRHFILPALATSFVQAPMFAFITASSGVFQGVYGLSSTNYGVVFGLIATALIVFGQINTWLLNRYSPPRIVSGALPLFMLMAIVLLVNSSSTSIWLVAIPLWVSLGMVGLLAANMMSIAMAGSKDAAGLGSAAIGALQFAVAFTVSSLVAIAGTDSATPMALAILISALIGSTIWFLACKLSSAEVIPQ